MGVHDMVWPTVPRFVRGSLAWVCIGLLTGCSPTVPDVSSDINLAAVYDTENQDAASLAGIPEIGFKDPVLTQLVTAALDGNPGLAAAQARLRAAAAEARAAGAEVSGNGDVGLRSDNTGTGSLDAGLAARLDPSRPARQAAAVARAEAAQFDADDARRLLVEQLVTTYIDLRFFQQLLEYRRADVASRRRTLNDLEILLGAGAATEVDVVSARALLVEARGQLPQIEAQALRQRNQLAALVGRPSGEFGVNLTFARKQPLPQGKVDQGLPADLLRARPDVRRAERLYVAAVADISTARAALYPSLTLSGRIQVPLNNAPDLTTLTSGLSIPVFGRFALKAGVDAAEARAAAAFQQWRTTVLTSVQELESALTSRAAAERTAAAAEEVVALQRRALTLSRRLLVESGDVTALDVLDREQAVTQARTSLAESRRDVALAHIALLSALGLDRGMESKVGN